jgi:surface protein
MTLVFDTRNTKTGSSASNQIRLPQNTDAHDLAINYLVDYGDGNFARLTTKAAVLTPYTYAVAGIYEVKIYTLKNKFIELRYENHNAEANKLIEIKSWGRFRNSRACFHSCINLELKNIVGGLPTFSGNADGNFNSCTSLTTADGLDDFTITNGSAAMFFFNCFNFNQPLNINLPMADTLRWFLAGCSKFNSPVILNAPNNTNLQEVFQNCTIFNQPLPNLCTSKVIYLERTFQNCRAFNQPLNTWDTSNVITIQELFSGATSFNQDLSTWDMSNVKNMRGMFRSASSFNQDISMWNFHKDVILREFMLGKNFNNFSATNYDKLLKKWSERLIGRGRVETDNLIAMGTIKYTAVGKPYRDALVRAGFTITDGGMI